MASSSFTTQMYVCTCNFPNPAKTFLNGRNLGRSDAEVIATVKECDASKAKPE